MGIKLQKFFVERISEKNPENANFIKTMIEEQEKFLAENPLDLDSIESENNFCKDKLI